jgi:hypothetical protein
MGYILASLENICSIKIEHSSKKIICLNILPHDRQSMK